jgi:hypothetical protein
MAPPARRPHRLSLTLFRTNELDWVRQRSGLNPRRAAEQYLANAADILKAHGFSLDVEPAAKPGDQALGHRLAFHGPVMVQSQYTGIQRQIREQLPDDRRRVAIVFTSLLEISLFGPGPAIHCLPDGRSRTEWRLPTTYALTVNGLSPHFILVNLLQFTANPIILAHEIGHAAGLRHQRILGCTADKPGNLMNESAAFAGTSLEEWQVWALQGAFFAKAV